MLARAVSALTLLFSVALLPSPARAAADIGGPWFVHVLYDLGGAPGSDLVNDCHWDVVQAGTTLSASYTCTLSVGGASTGTYSGTIDPDAGTFSLSAPVIACTGNGGVEVLSGTIAAGSLSFSGTGACAPFGSSTFIASLCRNGVVDDAEGCDEGIDAGDADCCTNSCQPKAAGASCGDDGDDNACTSFVCDGTSGTCPVTNEPLPAGRICGEVAGCTAPSCDGAGSCSDTLTLADDSFCYGQCFKGQGTCQAGVCSAPQLPAGTGCSADGNPCTRDACDASGVCTVGGCSACCDDSGGSCVPAYEATCEHATIAKSTVSLKRKTGSLAWNWKQGDELDFGDLAADGAALCVYNGSTSALMALTEAASGACGSPPCWKSVGATARYRSAKSEPLRALVLHEGAGSKGKISARAKGLQFLHWDQPSSADAVSTPVRVQLKVGGRCWESTFASPLRNNDDLFVAARGSASGAFVDPLVPGF